MKTLTRIVATLMLGAAFLMTATLAPSVASAQDRTNSKDGARLIKSVQEAMNARRYPDAINRIKEFEALPKKTAYDEYLIGELAGFLYTRTNETATAVKYLEAGLASPFFPQSQVHGRILNLMGLNYDLKNYDKVIDYGNRAIKGGFATTSTYQSIAQAYFLKGSYKDTLKVTDGLLDDMQKRGETPKEDLLTLVVNSCKRLEDRACETRAFEKLVTYYPKQEYWQNLLDALLRSSTTTSNETLLLDVYRLADEVNAVTKPEDVREMAQLCLDAGSAGEAQRALEKAFAKNVFAAPKDKERNQRLLDAAKKQAVADQAAIPKLEADSANAAGDQLVALGRAYLSSAQYDKAAAAFGRAVSKGGLKNETEARLLLGISQLKAGHREEANRAFHAVKGDPTLERLANLWTLHARQA